MNKEHIHEPSKYVNAGNISKINKHNAQKHKSDFFFFFHWIRKTPRKANTSYYDDAENTRFLYMGLCTRVLYTIQHLSNDYSSWIETGNLIFGTLLHNYLTKSISFSANKYLSKLHTSNDNGFFFVAILYRIPHKSACNSLC